jgi:ABC-type multidrug transport system ATPase subunit
MAVVYRSQRNKALTRLKPKLFSIQQRLETYYHDKHLDQKPFNSSTLEGSSTPRAVWVHESGKIRYDARKLFDMLDVNQDGTLSYEELQLVLELKPEQLREFVWRMNNLDHVKSETEVSRECFARNFLRVLEETVYFGPTMEEVEELFEELSGGQPAILYSSLYDSQLSVFLSDPQINQLITLFKKATTTDERLRRQQSRKSRRSMFSDAPMVEEEVEDKLGLATSGSNVLSIEDSKRYLHHDYFVAHYASTLAQITDVEVKVTDSSVKSDGERSRGVDLAFENLTLTVRVGGNEINVVNNVSGRLQASTMTALMGGSGCGKTSLLNALCGRAFYGTTSGTVRINGHVASIEEHKDATGFVPQSDDSVHAELTVKENLVYSGRFTLPKGTPIEDIEDYADQVMANLGLSRVADSIVGDVNRRGVSGGEKKRVNIGIELMSKPSILFLDEPTSGLDSSSALLVMSSLKNLVKSAGMTICSVIHQPRKQIFESFDCLLLLGVGGNMVYHGPVCDAQAYFESLPDPYFLPLGESVADWLIDVSSGRLPPSQGAGSSSAVLEGDDEKDIHNSDGRVFSSRGPSAAMFEESMEMDKGRRQVLYDAWNANFKNLSKEALARYNPPEQYKLPVSAIKPSFLSQLRIQIGRNFLIMWRNRTSKMIDTILIVGAVVLISAMEGVLKVTRPTQPNLTFDELVEGDPYEIPKTFPELFTYALGATKPMVEFALKIGVITSVLLGLTAAKALTSKRLEFFRESGSGWSKSCLAVPFASNSIVSRRVVSPPLPTI